MAVTTGFVQRTKIHAAGTGVHEACVYVGPSPAKVEILYIRRQVNDPIGVGVFRNAMLEALNMALASRREVVVSHSNATIEGVLIR